jgi:AcrR family transcriptional regulator
VIAGSSDAPQTDPPPHDAALRNGASISRASWRNYDKNTLPPILDSALERFMGHGFHGTTIRQIAERVGLSVPGLYHHYPSKQALLVALMSHAMTDLWHRSTAAIDEADDSVVLQFELLVECLVLFHASRRNLAFIAYSEIRSLDPEARERHIAARDRQQGLMDSIVRRGIDEGVFHAQHPRELSTAIITMCTGVAQWYQPHGALSPEEVAQRYRLIAARAVGSVALGK